MPWGQEAASLLDEAFGGAPEGRSRDLPVSVVVVGRNYGRFLKDCLSSVIRQKPGPKEIVYVDNASTDDSVAVA